MATTSPNGKTTIHTLLDAATSTTTAELETTEQLQTAIAGIEITDTATVKLEASFDGGSTWLEIKSVSDQNDISTLSALPANLRANVSSYTSGDVSVWVERNMQAAG